MSLAIRVDGLGKEYRIGRLRPRLTTFRELIVDTLLQPVRDAGARLQGRPSDARESTQRIWALKDVSFELQHGEVVGIVGGNGAGKSTLLKIISRITEPTTGTIEIHGRVGSLLEVGTGFHQELTGRENIYLNGAILGMRRREIMARFDDIVDFAEMERFIDTPVKHYSTGMYLRLAFSVAAHLESDVLIVDEVLAVGDQAFQRKCLAKIEALSRDGRTVLFVSHYMGMVERLCNRCLLFRGGHLVADGDTADIIAKYQTVEMNASARTDLSSHPGRAYGSVPIMTDVNLVDGLGEATSCIRMQSAFSIEVGLGITSAPIRPVLGVVVKTPMGTPLFGANNRSVANGAGLISHGVITCRFDKLPLMPGKYVIDLYLGDRHRDRDMDIVHEAASFEVVPGDLLGSSLMPPRAAGPIFWPATFELRNGQSPA